MKIMVADREEYNDYFSKKTDTLNVKILNGQENYIIHSIETEENDASAIYSSINKLLDEQYKKGEYISLEQLNELDCLFMSLNEEQCKIIKVLQYLDTEIYTKNKVKLEKKNMKIFKSC